MYKVNKADSGLLNGSSSLGHRRSFCFGYIKNVLTVPKQKLRLSANLTGLFFEIPYDNIHSTLGLIWVDTTKHKITCISE